MFCRQCGKEIDDDSIFCVHCGIAMAQAVPTQQPVYMVKKRRIWPYALIACVAILSPFCYLMAVSPAIPPQKQRLKLISKPGIPKMSK